MSGNQCPFKMGSWSTVSNNTSSSAKVAPFRNKISLDQFLEKRKNIRKVRGRNLDQVANSRNIEAVWAFGRGTGLSCQPINIEPLYTQVP
jgi:hypothetical protein